MTAAASVLLENFTKTAAKPSSRTVQRLKAREVLRDLTELKRLRKCGLAIGGEVRLKVAEAVHGTSGGISGLGVCGSVWVCPVCASKIAMTRTDDLEKGIQHWASHGNSFVMLTLTMQHHKGQRLSTLWDGLSDAWRKFVSDGSAKRVRAGLGVNGYHRTTEVTLGANGWHVHLHVLYFIEGKPLDLTSADAGSKLVARWMESVERAGFRAVSDAQDWKILRGNADALAGVSGYLIKGEYRERAEGMGKNSRAVAMEMTRGDLKSARLEGSRTPFELLADVVDSVRETGEIPEDDFALWQEWERASKGRRQQVWSRGMRERLGLDDEMTDEEAAEVEVEGMDTLAISAEEWKRFTRDPNAHAELIHAVEQAGSIETARIAAANLLTQRGIKFRLIFPEFE